MKISRYRTALMGIAALWIWYFHCGMQLFVEKQGILHEIAWYIKDVGFCGVDIFLLLSGMGLYYHFTKTEIHTVKDYGNYILRRFSKIYKVFLPATIVFALIKNWTFREFILNLTTYNNFARYVYSHLWFVSCILLLYVIAPVFYVCVRYQKHYILTLTLMIVLEILLIFGTHDFIRDDLFLIINRIPVFTLGFGIGKLEHDNLWKRKIGYGIAGVTLIIGLIYTYYINSDKIKSVIPCQNSLANIWVAFGIVVLIPTLLNWIEVRKCGKYLIRAFNFYGLISFEFYCYQEKIDAYIFKNADSIISDIMSLMVATVVAYAAHYLATHIDIKISLKRDYKEQERKHD